MLSESFAQGVSLLHRLDPRLRIVFATLFSFLLALSLKFPTLVSGLAMSVILVWISRLPRMEVARRLTVVNIFNIVLFLVLPITFEGTIAFFLGPVACTREGLLLAARITLKSNINTYKTYAYLFGMLLVRALARADRVYQSMLCRGFKGKFYCIHQFSFSRTDRIGSGCLFLTLILLGGMEWLAPTLF
ncbi:energy-coupling factor transporter transmembrane component T family protein [Desulfosarcina ovata]|uniref:Cobalt ECF transporter T component CbiQ n=1 Tax=Desulfosarcina ovata subsp. ovata TaxID=2752305 RepID=A0A5K8ACD0_9BACT|nr:energy-coupling factor transporter transmembrane component T [Desulfosarcina ovata]BBO89664.1 hypothetical protein DSCOOX_28440 [Desulfosarcina ovata subsp. ovata]